MYNLVAIEINAISIIGPRGPIFTGDFRNELQFSFAEFRMCKICLITTTEESSYQVYCFAASLRKVKVASRYRAFSNSCYLFIRIVLTFNFEFKVLTDRNKRRKMLSLLLGSVNLFIHRLYRRLP